MTTRQPISSRVPARLLSLSAMTLALACGGTAHAAVSVVNFTTSINGVNWNPSTQIDVSGGSRRVLVRASISYVPSPGDGAVAGFASCTMQPVFSNVNFATDHIAPFAISGNNTNGGAVALDSTPLNGPFGRLIPFASTGPTTTDPYFVHFHSGGSSGAPQGNYYRIARTSIGNWTGVGPTTTSNAVNNFNGAGGLAIVQKSAGLVILGLDPPFNSATTNVTLLQFAIDIDAHNGTPSRIIDISVPANGISRNPTTGLREAAWFSSRSDNFGATKTTVQFNPAQIVVVPAPGVASICGVAALVITRRRRR